MKIENDEATATIVAAPLGYFTICVFDDDSVWVEAIIAFFITNGGHTPAGDPIASVWPITLEGVCPNDHILRPDGSVSIVGVRDFRNKEEYLEYVNKNKSKSSA